MDTLEKLYSEEVWEEEHLLLLDKRMDSITTFTEELKLMMLRFLQKSELERRFWGGGQPPF